MEIQFLVNEEADKDVLRSIGFTTPSAVPMCPLQVGDVITQFGQEAGAMQVVQRWFSAHATGGGVWTVVLEKTRHPLSAPIPPNP